MSGTLTPEQARAAHLGQVRLMWLRVALVGKDGRGLQEATGNPATVAFFPNQEAAILGYDRLQATEKCRQIGHSFALAADSLARAATEAHTTAVHISTDKWESESKQGYVKRMLDSLNRAARADIKLLSDAKNHLELETKNGVAHINFLAQRDPRGAERAGVYLHEMAHMALLQAILKGSVAATLHGGFIKGCSTHEGATNRFNLIMTNAADEETGERPYRNWSRYTFPWWLCPAFCYDIEAAAHMAPQLETDERLEKFGKTAIQDMRLSSSLMEFQEECECLVVDGRYSYFPMELIEACIAANLVFEKIEVDASKPFAVDDVKAKIDWLRRQISDGTIKGEFAWAYDIGRYFNPDAIVVGHAMDLDPQNLQINLIISMENLPFEKKQAIIGYLMEQLPVKRGHIDSTGMGKQIGEWAYENFGDRAIPIDFNNDLKSTITNNLKIRMERRDAFGNRRLLLPLFGKLTKQIHAIRKTVTPLGKPIYDSKKEDETHGDMYWATALFNSIFETPEASYAFTPTVMKRPTYPGAGVGGFGGFRRSQGGIWTP